MAYQKPFNVLTYDYECSCFGCDKPTRHYVIEYEKPLCMDCIMILSAVEVMAKPFTDQIDRHFNN